MEGGLASDGLVFAGGGARCFWQMGFIDALRDHAPLAPKAVAAVSAGSAIACAVFAGRDGHALDRFKALTQENARNAYPKLALRRGRAVFPHLAMYRSAILDAMDPEALDRRAGAGQRMRNTSAYWASPNSEPASTGSRNRREDRRLRGADASTPETLVATLAVYLNALEGKGAHVVTVNDYLASRDAAWMGEIFQFLGLTVGVIESGRADNELRREAYGPQHPAVAMVLHALGDALPASS